MVDDDKSRNKTKINQASLMKRDPYIRAIYNLEINHMIKKIKNSFWKTTNLLRTKKIHNRIALVDVIV